MVPDLGFFRPRKSAIGTKPTSKNTTPTSQSAFWVTNKMKCIKEKEKQQENHGKNGCDANWVIEVIRPVHLRRKRAAMFTQENAGK